MELLVIILNSAGYIFYTKKFIKEKIESGVLSWIIWETLNLIAFFAIKTKNDPNYLLKSAIVGTAVVLIFSFLYGKYTWKWNWFDIICSIGALFAVILLVYFKDPLTALWCTTIAAIIGSLPVMRTVWEEVKKQSVIAWILFSSASCLMLYLVDEWTVFKWLQPATFVAVNTIGMMIIISRRFFLFFKERKKNKT